MKYPTENFALSVADYEAVLLVDSPELADEFTVYRFQSQLRGLPSGRLDRVVIDLRNVALLSSCAIGVLVEFDRRMQAAGVELVLRGVRPSCLEVFAFMRLEKILRIETLAA